jgi:hypothetical protein
LLRRSTREACDGSRRPVARNFSEEHAGPRQVIHAHPRVTRGPTGISVLSAFIGAVAVTLSAKWLRLYFWAWRWGSRGFWRSGRHGSLRGTRGGTRDQRVPFGLGPLFPKTRCHRFQDFRVNPRLLLRYTRPVSRLVDVRFHPAPALRTQAEHRAMSEKCQFAEVTAVG